MMSLTKVRTNACGETRNKTFEREVPNTVLLKFKDGRQALQIEDEARVCAAFYRELHCKSNKVDKKPKCTAGQMDYFAHATYACTASLSYQKEFHRSSSSRSRAMDHLRGFSVQRPRDMSQHHRQTLDTRAERAADH